MIGHQGSALHTIALLGVGLVCGVIALGVYRHGPRRAYKVGESRRSRPPLAAGAQAVSVAAYLVGLAALYLANVPQLWHAVH